MGTRVRGRRDITRAATRYMIRELSGRFRYGQAFFARPLLTLPRLRLLRALGILPRLMRPDM